MSNKQINNHLFILCIYFVINNLDYDIKSNIILKYLKAPGDYVEQISFEKLIQKIKSYNECEVDFITKVYNFAYEQHKGMYRKSGEPYISHPLAVAYILAEMHADAATVAAGILHDIIEDTDIKKEDIARKFTEEIAELVDGVTKISKVNFINKNEANMANIRKIITSITKDIRIIIIKLADRLHNMRTLEFLPREKQIENSLETLQIFTPLANYIGAYHLKCELEDLAFKYLKREEYDKLNLMLEDYYTESKDVVETILSDIGKILFDDNIPFELKLRTKNVYNVYKKLLNNNNLNDIHNLIAIRVIVDDIKACYQALGSIHSIYYPFNEKFRDYISLPKTNMYSSIHTTLFGPEDHLFQAQIRTKEMEVINNYGLTAYWYINKGLARQKMQEDLTKKFQFVKTLSIIDLFSTDNREFVDNIKRELFTGNIYVYNSNGQLIELPEGSVPIDLAFRLGEEIGIKVVKVFVNDKPVPLNYKLQNQDRVKIITDDHSPGLGIEWVDHVSTIYAKRKIQQYYRNKMKK